MPRSFLIALALSLAAAARPARATTVVAVKTPTEVVIGADSKVTDTFGNAFERQACKIVPAGSVVFAYEGMARDRRTGFDVARTARAALLARREATAAERVGDMTGALADALFAELPRLKRLDPDTYRVKVEGRVFLKILVAAFEGGRPLLFVRHFRAAPSRADIVGVTVIPDDCLADCGGGAGATHVMRFLGESEAIEGLAEETPGFWDEGVAEGVRRLVETEIAARAEYVGPPVDILRLDRSGARWVQKKPACPATQQTRRGARR
jgi:hypothetical protein